MNKVLVVGKPNKQVIEIIAGEPIKDLVVTTGEGDLRDLAKDIEMMSMVDGVYFANNTGAPGANVLYFTALEYGLNIIGKQPQFFGEKGGM